MHNVLSEIMGDLKRILKQNGRIVLSGILEGKEGVVVEAVKRENLKILEEMHQAEWLAFVVERED